MASPQPRYATILLDLDHTLLDSDTSETTAFQVTLATFGAQDPASYRSTYDRINRALWERVEQGEVDPQHVKTARFEQLVAETGLVANPVDMAEVFANALGAHGELYPGARLALEQLAQTATLALVTNGLSEVQRSRIDRLDLERYFDAVVISAEVGTSKPGTDIFDIAFEELGNPARQSALMVGDSLTSDIQGGTNYGIATCWYNPHSKQAGPNDHITHEISRLDQLPALMPAGGSPTESPVRQGSDRH